MVHADLGQARAGVLELAHELDADHSGRLLELDGLELRPAHEPEVAVGIAKSEAEDERDEPVVDATDDLPGEIVRPVELVALHDVDVAVGLGDEELELAGVELTVAVRVEDPLLGRRTESRQQRASVPA